MKLTIEPTGRRIELNPGESVQDALCRAGIVETNPCNGKGLCGQCRIHVLGTNVPETPHRKISSEDGAVFRDMGGKAS